MEDFLAFIECFPHFQLGQADLDKECGPDTVVALRQQGILAHHGKQICRLPCGIHKEFGACSRWLRYSAAQNDYVAVCQSRAISCPRQIEPQYRDLRAWEFDQESFARYVQHLLGLTGSLVRKEWLDQPLWDLGHRDLGQTKEDVYVLFQPHRVGFAMMLAQLSNSFCEAWVLVPTWAHIEQSIRSQYSVHTSVTVCALSDLLAVNGRHIVLDRVLRKAQQRLFSKPAKTTPPFCVLYRNDADPQMLSEAEYNTFQDKIPDFHLLIDLQKPKDKGVHLAHVLRDGQLTNEPLTTAEANVLAFLMRSRAPLPVRQIIPLQNLASPTQLFDRARRQVDVRIRQNQWTFFHTIASYGQRDRCYQFAPPPNTRWALIVPYRMIADDVALKIDDAMAHPRLQF